ncbi:uncharacterized protein LOC133814478 [Humulus lupulus]|uniref:uncharacterized protein LOC133814478 n=1 Tax=Humulus lupulus TaxID=3486 RepID=UPI002B407006|nr:uncharacterized protein LOC133814478 [Humulus lupulus]
MIPSTQHPQPPKLPRVEPLTQELVSISHNDSTSMSSNLTSLLKFVSPWDNDYHKKINIPSHVFGYNTIATLFNDDVTQFYNMDKIGQTPMILYLRLLDDILHTNGLDHLYAFQHLGEVSVGHENKRAQALKDRYIQMGENHFLICPWNNNEHWMLLLFQPHSHSVAFLDPINLQLRIEIKNIVRLAFTLYHTEKGKRVVSLKYYSPKCRQQPKTTECDLPYTDAKLNEVQEEWAKYILLQLAK